MADYAKQSGYEVVPDDPANERPSFITAIQLDSPERMVRFCEVVQQNSPVGSYVKPIAGGKLSNAFDVHCSRTHQSIST